FVDADNRRDVLAEEHLVNRQPPDVAVHRGDPMELPILRVFFDVLVNRVAMLQGAANQRIGEQTHLGLPGGGWWQFDRLAPRRRAFFPADGLRALRGPAFLY